MTGSSRCTWPNWAVRGTPPNPSGIKALRNQFREMVDMNEATDEHLYGCLIDAQRKRGSLSINPDKFLAVFDCLRCRAWGFCREELTEN